MSQIKLDPTPGLLSVESILAEPAMFRPLSEAVNTFDAHLERARGQQPQTTSDASDPTGPPRAAVDEPSASAAQVTEEGPRDDGQEMTDTRAEQPADSEAIDDEPTDAAEDNAGGDDDASDGAAGAPAEDEKKEEPTDESAEGESAGPQAAVVAETVVAEHLSEATSGSGENADSEKAPVNQAAQSDQGAARSVVEQPVEIGGDAQEPLQQEPAGEQPHESVEQGRAGTETTIGDAVEAEGEAELQPTTPTGEKSGDSPANAAENTKRRSAGSAAGSDGVAEPRAAQGPAQTAAVMPGAELQAASADRAKDVAEQPVDQADGASKPVAGAETANTTGAPARTGMSPATPTDSAHPAREEPGATQVDRARFVQRVVKAFQAMGSRDGSVRLRLSPPSLGTLRLEISVQDGMMSARMEAETQTARNLLLDNLPALRQRLAEQNIKVEQFNVDVMDHSPGGLPDRTADQAESRDRGAAGDSSQGDAEADTQDTPGDAVVNRPGEGTQLNVVV